MMKRITHCIMLLLIVMMIVMLFSLNGCGKDDIYTSQYGGSVVVNPDAISYSLATYPACVGTCGAFQCSETTSFKITVLNRQGSPVNNAAITVQVPFSAGSGGGATPTLMYVVDGDTGFMVATYPYNTYTGDNGTKDITLILDASCPWGPVDIGVWSGTAYASLEVKVE